MKKIIKLQKILKKYNFDNINFENEKKYFRLFLIFNYNVM